MSKCEGTGQDGSSLRAFVCLYCSDFSICQHCTFYSLYTHLIVFIMYAVKI